MSAPPPGRRRTPTSDRVIQAIGARTMPEEIIARDYANDGGSPGASASRRSSLPMSLVGHYRSVADYAFERGLVRNKVDVGAN
jgi:sulfonate transport system substrate-binding protein